MPESNTENESSSLREPLLAQAETQTSGDSNQDDDRELERLAAVFDRHNQGDEEGAEESGLEDSHLNDGNTADTPGDDDNGSSGPAALPTTMPTSWAAAEVRDMPRARQRHRPVVQQEGQQLGSPAPVCCVLFGLLGYLLIKILLMQACMTNLCPINRDCADSCW